MKKMKFLSGLVILAAIINLFAFNSSVNAITEEEQSKLSETVILYIGSSDAYVNTVKTKIDPDNRKIVPIIKEGRTLVPVRFVSESLKADVDWDSVNSIVTIRLGENTAILRPGKKIMALNDNPVELDVPPEIIEGRTYLPLRRLVEDVLNKNIFYDRNVIIISDKDTVFDKDADKKLIDDLVYMFGQDYATVHVSGGYSHSVAIKRDGTVWEWGETLSGNKLIPERVEGLERIIDISAGNKYTLALKIDGTVWAWGKNEDGNIGDGTQIDRETPVKVKNLTKIKRIAASFGGHCLAVNTDGKVWAWGNNDYGQLGIGTKENELTPVMIDKLTQIEDIAVGYNFSAALDKEGNVWTWGNNENSYPKKLKDLNNIIDIAAGQSHLLALRNDGTVWIWGNFEEMPVYRGQVKKNTDTSVPVKIEELKGIIAIAAQGGYSAVLKDDGSMFVWGYLNSELDLEDNLVPTIIEELNGVREIAAGGGHLLALKDDGSLWAFGINTNGQIGDGTTISRKKPTVTAFNKDPLVVTEIAAKAKAFENKFDDATVKELDKLTDELLTKYDYNQGKKFIDRSNMKVVVVNDAWEFINAIGSNREIILKSEAVYDITLAVYDITSALNEDIDNEKVYYRMVNGGPELVISNVENLIIRSESSKLANLMASPTYSYVLNFEDSRNIVIEGVNAGHGPEKGECRGGVFSFERCSNVYINNSILYGCGTEGISLSNVENFTFDNSIIEDCTYHLMTVKESKDVVFNNSKFRNTGVYDLINISDSKNVLFNSCEISDNEIFLDEHIFNLSNVEPKLIVKDTIIRDNMAGYLQKYKEDIYFKNITADNNIFMSELYGVD